ncbi:MAG: histidine kinase [Sphaerochaetaceae bacterium]|nr:histidine kinase [Sphaerochaetaceae bacterium]
MLQRIAFRHRLFITYSLSIVFLLILLALFFYRYSVSLFENSSIESTDTLSARMSDQLDSLFKPMDFIANDLLSDSSFKTALLVLDTLDREDVNNARFTAEAEQNIRKQLYSYSIFKNFYAVTVFNAQDDFFTSNFIEHIAVNSAEGLFTSIPWKEEAEAARGSMITTPVMTDPADPQGRREIFGRSRVVPGGERDIGIISVSYTRDVLDRLFDLPLSPDITLYAILPSGQPLYPYEGISESLQDYYFTYSNQSEEPFEKNPVTGEREYISSSTSAYTGITVLAVANRDILISPLDYTRGIILSIGVLIILFSLAYNTIATRVVIKPLRLIQERIEETEVNNLAEGEELVHENDEIVALDRSFLHLKERLAQSITREIDSRGLWLQARYDSLQSQVNPHFINNILTVIAGKAIEIGNHDIGEICDGVSRMLSYSTQTRVPYAPLSLEAEHLATYLYLMKQRLEERLEYTIDIEDAILTAHTPRIIFQPIAENSIAHGYNNTLRTMHLSVKGEVRGSAWQVTITDDGEGFSEESLKTLEQRVEQIDSSPERSVLIEGLSLGGTGLINTYARLHLFYGEALIWDVGNNREGGARITLGGPLDYEYSTVFDPSR